MIRAFRVYGQAVLTHLCPMFLKKDICKQHRHRLEGSWRRHLISVCPFCCSYVYLSLSQIYECPSCESSSANNGLVVHFKRGLECLNTLLFCVYTESSIFYINYLCYNILIHTVLAVLWNRVYNLCTLYVLKGEDRG